MTQADYIRDKFQTFGINLSEADILDILRDTGEGEVEADKLDVLNVKIVRFIPSLLVRASVSESGISFTLPQRENILSYYSLKCKEIGRAHV